MRAPKITEVEVRRMRELSCAPELRTGSGGVHNVQAVMRAHT